jgi:hypothetical protein
MYNVVQISITPGPSAHDPKDAGPIVIATDEPRTMHFVRVGLWSSFLVWAVRKHARYLAGN